MMVLALAVLTGCEGGSLDSMFWDNQHAESIADYHDLPLYVGEAPPDWLDEDSVERNLYIGVPSAKLLSDTKPPGKGEYLHAVFLPEPTACDTCPLVGSGVTFVFQHGNSGDLFRYWYRAVALHSLGANVLLYTYRGFGISSGEDVLRENVLDDAEAALTYVRARPDVDPDRVIAYGYSTGAIPTSWLAAESPGLAGVILESGLDSIESVLHIGTGTELPGGFFLDETLFDGPTFLEGGIDAPVLHLWGAQDLRVYREQTERYHQVLRNHSDYTSYFGETERPVDEWMGVAGHRNVPAWAFAAEHHISDYWDDPANPSHCCVHPEELGESQFSAFLRKVGGTTSDEMVASSAQYRDLVSEWVLALSPQP